MRINDKIKERFEVTVDKTTLVLIEFINEKKKDLHWIDEILGDNIDYQEMDINQNKIEIIRKPKGYSPFRPFGKISIDLHDIENSKSKLSIEIVPFNNTLPLILIGVSVFLLLWTIIVMMTTDVSNAIVMISFAWISIGLILYIQYRLYKSELLNYSKRLINELKKATLRPTANKSA